MKLHDLLNKLESQEQSFLGSEVLAPVMAGHVVTVRIAGIVCRLQLDDQQFQGWAVLQPLATDRARILRPANRSEVQKYLQLLPAVHLIAMARPGATGKATEKATWHALPAHQGDQRFTLKGPVPVLFCEENIQPFDAIVARFDGRCFWYERLNTRRNPALAAYLRESFNGSFAPDKLHKKGLSLEERQAYAWAWQSLEEARRNHEEVRLADALAHAEGRLLSFIDRDNVYTVTYRIHNRTHTSTVRKDDLTVLTSGICLSGKDRDFDLTSIVGVMREAATIGMEQYDDEY